MRINIDERASSPPSPPPRDSAIAIFRASAPRRSFRVGFSPFFFPSRPPRFAPFLDPRGAPLPFPARLYSSLPLSRARSPRFSLPVTARDLLSASIRFFLAGHSLFRSRSARVPLAFAWPPRTKHTVSKLARLASAIFTHSTAPRATFPVSFTLAPPRIVRTQHTPTIVYPVRLCVCVCVCVCVWMCARYVSLSFSLSLSHIFISLFLSFCPWFPIQSTST